MAHARPPPAAHSAGVRLAGCHGCEGFISIPTLGYGDRVVEHDKGYVDHQTSLELVEKWAGKRQITDLDAPFAKGQRDRHRLVVDPREP